jgi:hypothetical protein
MSKQSNHTQDLGINASQKPSDTPDILTAFISWMETQNRDEYVNLRFQHGSKLFMRENGVFIIQVTRVAFEAFKYEFSNQTSPTSSD